ncbi:MAG: DNA (cytosine-5-)-methyltransferase [Bacteroidota bacterium]
MKFIDLFAGLGGFHVGLSKLGHTCVFASEKNSELAELYSKNFGIECIGDIRKVESQEIPEHDILCAGFPCQPFSKAGSQLGLKDERGELFYEIARILDYHRPRFIFLENVANLKRHDQGNTWDTIEAELRALGYHHLRTKIISPHQFGIPQIRDRIFIIGSREKDDLESFSFPEGETMISTHVETILDTTIDEYDLLLPRQLECIEIWQEFIDVIPKRIPLPSFPIWAMEFGATYPYEELAPHKYTNAYLRQFDGAFGKPLRGKTKQDILSGLPSYAKTDKAKFPRWKKTFIRQNREWYQLVKPFIDHLLPTIQSFPNSWQKFEWNCKGEERDLYKLILQFRASGLRTKRPQHAPSLVASTLTQLPIIGWELRYMTKNEAAKLQSLECIELPDSKASAFKALGNAVNADLVRMIAEKLWINEAVKV